MQPPNNSGRRGQPFDNQPTKAYQQPPWPPQPGQFQPPSPMKPPDHTRRNAWLIILAVVLGGFMLIGIFSPPSPSPSNTPATATPTVDLVISPTALAQHNPNLTTVASTPTPTPRPTATPTLKPVLRATPTSKPQPTPTLKPVLRATPTPRPQPTPTVHTGINGNPWGYDFNAGNLIYTPPSGFCNYFNCIATFYAPDDPGDGYIVECQDGTYSQSGGERGACSHHGGEMRPLYSH
jgi:hypothetical protein